MKDIWYACLNWFKNNANNTDYEVTNILLSKNTITLEER